MNVKLALRKNDKRLVSRFIAWWTNSVYSHCELVIGDLSYSASAMDGGVRAKHINYDPEKWDFVDLDWVDPETVKQFFLKTDHHKYGWFGLITSQLFNRTVTAENTQFCSQWCADAIGFPTAALYNPNSLKLLCEHVTECISGA